MEAEHPCSIAAGDLGKRRFVHPVHPGNMSDRIIFGHVERIVGSHHNAIGTEHVDQVSQLVLGENDGIEIDLPQIGGRRQRQIAVAILPSTPGVIDAAGVARQIAAAVHGH